MTIALGFDEVIVEAPQLSVAEIDVLFEVTVEGPPLPYASTEVPLPTLVEAPTDGVGTVVPVVGAPGPPGADGVGTVEEITEIAETAVLTHELDTTPHPAYDDLPSLVLLFENGLI